MTARDLDSDEESTGKARSVLNEWVRSVDPLTPLLESDERVIWRAMGSGFDHRPYLAAIYAAIAVVAIVWAWPKMPAEQIRLPELQPMGGALFLILLLGSLYQLGGYTRRMRQRYTLTDRRLFVQVGAQTRPTSLAGVEDRLGLHITGIALKTGTSPSDITIFLEGSSALCILRGIENPLDAGIVTAGERAALTSAAHAKVDEIPYDFIRKRLTIVVAPAATPGEHLIITKGAVANVLAVCTTIEDERGMSALDASWRSRLEDFYRAKSAEGFRVLAVAVRRVPARTITSPPRWSPPRRCTALPAENFAAASFTVTVVPGVARVASS